MSADTRNGNWDGEWDGIAYSARAIASPPPRAFPYGLVIDTKKKVFFLLPTLLLRGEKIASFGIASPGICTTTTTAFLSMPLLEALQHTYFIYLPYVLGWRRVTWNKNVSVIQIQCVRFREVEFDSAVTWSRLFSKDNRRLWEGIHNVVSLIHIGERDHMYHMALTTSKTILTLLLQRRGLRRRSTDRGRAHHRFQQFQPPTP